MASTDETFLPCGSTYRSSHWIGRSTSGLRPCCCYRGDRQLVSTSSLWIVFELTNVARTSKIRAGSDLQHNVQDIYIERERENFHSKLVYVGVAQARPNYVQFNSVTNLSTQWHEWEYCYAPTEIKRLNYIVHFTQNVAPSLLFGHPFSHRVVGHTTLSTAATVVVNTLLMREIVFHVV